MISHSLRKLFILPRAPLGPALLLRKGFNDQSLTQKAFYPPQGPLGSGTVIEKRIQLSVTHSESFLSCNGLPLFAFQKFMETCKELFSSVLRSFASTKLVQLMPLVSNWSGRRGGSCFSLAYNPGKT